MAHVHFILGVNQTALGHSVRARYGANFDAERYLRRFVSVSMRLPDHIGNQQDAPLTLSYLRRTAETMGFDRELLDQLERHVALIIRHQALSLRDVNQILSHLALWHPGSMPRELFGTSYLFLSLFLFRFLSPELEEKALRGTLTIEDVRDFYGISRQMIDNADHAGYNHDAYIILGLWEFVLTNGNVPTRDNSSVARSFDSPRNPQRLPRAIHRRHLATFSLPKADDI